MMMKMTCLSDKSIYNQFHLHTYLQLTVLKTCVLNKIVNVNGLNHNSIILFTPIFGCFHLLYFYYYYIYFIYNSNKYIYINKLYCKWIVNGL